jgi:hypothetical protein
MFPTDQIDELKELYPGLCLIEETGVSYLLLPALVLPKGCQPEKVDALLCPAGRDGYSSRLFFAQRVQCPKSLNWNANGVRIAERNWHAYSWRIPGSNLRLAQMVFTHLTALQCN